MNHFEPKPITPEYLLKIGFEQINDIVYCFSVKMEIFNSVVIQAECDDNILVLSMTIEGCDRWTILPHETEQQLNKLINALQGK